MRWICGVKFLIHVITWDYATKFQDEVMFVGFSIRITKFVFACGYVSAGVLL